MIFILDGVVAMIKFENVSFCYLEPEEVIFENIDVSIAKGELFALLGTSGIGKSTLIRLVSGIEKPKSGNIYIDSKIVNPKEHRLGLVPQDNGLVEWLSVRDNICIGTEIKKNFDENLFEAIIEIMGISNLLDKYPSNLSGGQQKRVSIARALLVKPQVLLLDEPFVSLDEQTSLKIQELIIRLHKEYKVTMILVTHRYKEALYLGERIGVLGGKPARFVKFIKNDIQGVREGLDLEVYLDRLNALESVMKGSNIL